MQPRVTAILVARSGAEFLERTLKALSAQTRKPDTTIAVDVSSRDASEAMLSAFGPTQLLTIRDGSSFGAGAAHAVHFAEPVASDNEWLWLLRHDSAPDPDALERLLGAVEIAPSVAVAGPKLMNWSQSDQIVSFGETMSRFGTSVHLVDGELDQAQHDTQDDVLGVAAAGMLVRRSLWSKLGGFDPGLPSVDAALDFCVRARLAGHRVVLVPSARLASVGGPELFGKKSISPRRRFSLGRAAQLHRRLVYAPGWAVPLHWLSLLPLAVIRSIGDLVGKRPWIVGGEFRAALRTAFSGRAQTARVNLTRTRKLGWAAVAPLRMSTGELLERRAQAREAALDPQWAGEGAAVGAGSAASVGGAGRDSVAVRAGFVAHGGIWAVLLTGVIGLISFGSLLGSGALGSGTLGGAASLSGGGLLPLSGTVAELWSHIGYGWREIGTGFLGAADPFAAVLAVLGSLTFWAPPFSVVLLYLVALPLAGLGAWFAARRFTSSPWLPALACLLWALAPPLLSGLNGGHLGAVIAHLLLPWLVLSALSAARSVAAAAAAALLFAAVAASAPSLMPALLLLWLAWMFARPRSLLRLVGIPIPALALFAPLIWQQLVRGNPLGLLADPGVAVATGAASGWRLALADPTGTLHGWPALLSAWSLPGAISPLLIACLFAPLALLALASLFLRGIRQSVPSAVVALLGYLTAVVGSHIQVSAAGSSPVTVFAGPGLSLFLLGLIGAALVTLDALGRVRMPVAVLAGVTSIVLALPMLVAMSLGNSAVHPSTARVLPAIVSAEAIGHPGVGTLVIRSEGASGVSGALQRGLGATLDDQSTLASTARRLTETDKRLANLVGNLALRSGYDPTDDFRELDIPFVIMSPGSQSDERYRSTVDALDGNEFLTPVGATGNGLLWRYDGETTADGTHPGNGETALGLWFLIGLGVVFGASALMAIPTGRPKRSVLRSRAGKGGEPDEPAATFDAESSDALDFEPGGDDG